MIANNYVEIDKRRALFDSFIINSNSNNDQELINYIFKKKFTLGISLFTSEIFMSIFEFISNETTIYSPKSFIFSIIRKIICKFKYSHLLK